jgi:hypothetical protein
MALYTFQTNSKLVWNCHQSLVNWQNITGSNWYECQDTWELMEMK